MVRLFNKLLNPLRRKIRQLFTRGLVTLVDPTTLMQTLQVELLSGEVLDKVEHFEGYGFTAHPNDGAEVLTVSLNGRRSHTIVLTVADRRFRLKNLAKGEVAIYTDEGDVIHFKRGNHIYIDSANQVTVKAATKVVMDAPLVEFTGDVDISGEATIGGIAFSTHVHPGDSGGTTGVPQ